MAAPSSDPSVDLETVVGDALAAGRFALLLKGHHGAGGFNRRRLDATVSVGADSAVGAARRGVTVVSGAARRCGLSDWSVTAVEAVDEAELQARLAVPQLPALAGTREVMAMIGVSRQRLAVLRTGPGFPTPITTLAATPVWDRAAVELWVQRWDRRPGRPSRAKTTATPGPAAAGAASTGGRNA